MSAQPASGIVAHVEASGSARATSRRRFVAGAAALAIAGNVRAQGVPPVVTMIVCAPAGGSADAVGRLVADSLADLLGTTFRVDNQGTNGGVTGVNALVAAPRDGTVVGLVASYALIGGRLLSRSAQYNPSQDFEWLTILGSYPNAVVVPSRSNFTTFAEWLEFARRTTTPLTYASFGAGSAGHLAGAYLRYEKGARLTHLTLASTDEGYAMLADGRIDALFDGTPNALVKVPRLGHRVIAVTSGARHPALPDVPAFGELFGESFVVWLGLVLPKGVPPAVYVRFASAVSVLVSEPAYVESLRGAGLSFMGLSGAGTRSYVDNEFLRIAKLVARLNDEGVRR